MVEGSGRFIGRHGGQGPKVKKRIEYIQPRGKREDGKVPPSYDTL